MPTIKTNFLPDLGLWKVTQSSQTCVAWRFGHKYLGDILAKDEVRRNLETRGVYILADDSAPNRRIAYVGEAENLAKRLKQHDGEVFWTFGITIFASNGFLEKSHIKYLEHSLWKAIKDAGSYTLENKTEPTKPFVSDPESLDDFLGAIKLFALPLGAPYLFVQTESPPPPPPPPLSRPACELYSPAGIFAVSIVELERRGLLTDMDVKFLSSKRAQTDLKAGYGDCPAIKRDSSSETPFVRKGIRRYQNPARICLVHGKARYRITTEVHDAADGSTPVFDWALERGLTNEDILSLCDRYHIRPRRKKST